MLVVIQVKNILGGDSYFSTSAITILNPPNAFLIADPFVVFNVTGTIR